MGTGATTVALYLLQYFCTDEKRPLLLGSFRRKIKEERTIQGGIRMQFLFIWWLVEMIADAWQDIKDARAENKKMKQPRVSTKRPAPTPSGVRFVQGYGRVKD